MVIKSSVRISFFNTGHSRLLFGLIHHKAFCKINYNKHLTSKSTFTHLDVFQGLFFITYWPEPPHRGKMNEVKISLKVRNFLTVEIETKTGQKNSKLKKNVQNYWWTSTRKSEIFFQQNFFKNAHFYLRLRAMGHRDGSSG